MELVRTIRGLSELLAIFPRFLPFWETCPIGVKFQTYPPLAGPHPIQAAPVLARVIPKGGQSLPEKLEVAGALEPVIQCWGVEAGGGETGYHTA